MEVPQATHTLKRDEFGRVEVVDGPDGEIIRRVACGNGRPGSRFLARVLMRRERRALRVLDGLSGVPRVLERPGYAAAPSPERPAARRGDVLLRSLLPGVPLSAADRLPADFFTLLAALVGRLHARGVCHNDLHKESNILVGPDGRPSVLDFQLASVHRRRGRRFATRAREDLRHVAKHRRRYFVATGRGEDPGGGGEPARRSLLAAAWARLGKPPYNFLTRRVLRTADTEARRPAEGPWPRWDPPAGERKGPGGP